MFLFFFFFKQKTAYEMRISDWSSDVCSSDLFGLRVHVIVRENEEDARAYTKTLMSKFDAEMGEKLKHRAQDSKSAGVLRQDELRKMPTLTILWSRCYGLESGVPVRVAGQPWWALPIRSLKKNGRASCRER